MGPGDVRCGVCHGDADRGECHHTHCPREARKKSYAELVAAEEERLRAIGGVRVLDVDVQENEVPNQDHEDLKGGGGYAPPQKLPRNDLSTDSGDGFLDALSGIAADDAAGLKAAQQSYGNSWKSRGGIGAFMMLARKWDRMENRLKKSLPGVTPYDIFAAIANDERPEGIIDDVRDLRRYLLLVEAEMVARGFHATHRDNV